MKSHKDDTLPIVMSNAPSDISAYWMPYDISSPSSCGSVSSLWDFTSDNPAVPDDSDIQNALSYVDYTRLKLTENNDGTYTVDKPDKTVIDLGAIAKGYIADKIRNFLLEKSINRGIINLGGNVLCVGEKSLDNPFLIGIKKPFSEDSVPLVTFVLIINPPYLPVTTKDTFIRMASFIIIF